MKLQPNDILQRGDELILQSRMKILVGGSIGDTVEKCMNGDRNILHVERPDHDKTLEECRQRIEADAEKIQTLREALERISEYSEKHDSILDGFVMARIFEALERTK